VIVSVVTDNCIYCNFVGSLKFLPTMPDLASKDLAERIFCGRGLGTRLPTLANKGSGMVQEEGWVVM